MKAFARLAAVLGMGLAVAGAAAPAGHAATQSPPGEALLLRQPAINARHLVFVRAGDLWIADRNGGEARRLTAHPAEENFPFLSPDGRFVAFVGHYNRNQDVYIIPVEGGQPRRLTFHPGADIVQGWTPDGRVLFSSAREVNGGRSAQLWSIAPDEAYPRKEMEARFAFGALKADGRTLAYIPFGPAYNALYSGSSGWRQHRGGTTPSINILDLKAQSLVRVPGERVNDLNPMWVGDDLYFLSDRDGVSLALHRFDAASGQVVKVASAAPWDIRWASAADGAIVFEAGGRLQEFNVTSGKVRAIPIYIAQDAAQLAPRWVDAGQGPGGASLSPTGARALFDRRGEVFTVPTGKEGSARNLTSTAEREYTPLWSPSGEQIAYISEAGGVQKLHVRDQRGLAAPRVLPLGEDPAAFYELRAWAPGGKRILYTDSRLNLFAIDLASGRSSKLDQHARWSDTALAVSPDGVWAAYTHAGPSGVTNLMLQNLETGRKLQASNGFAFVSEVVFSRDGKHLYFTASTNIGPSVFGLNMASSERPRRFGLYALTLAAAGKSPFLRAAGDEPKQDKEKPAEEGKKAAKPEENRSATVVDGEGLLSRISAFPVAERNYDTLMVGEDGALYFLDRPQPGASNDPPRARPGAETSLLRYDFTKREVQSVLSGVSGVSMSADGKMLLLQREGAAWSTAKAGETLKLEPLALAGVRLRIDPRKEWAQIFDEVWRMERAYFYDRKLHGLDWAAVRARYEPLLAHVMRREDLNALLSEMIGELQVGHNRINGGDVHEEARAPVGLLGADYRIEQGRYRFARIYTGESWNPFLEAPLAKPGVSVKAGDFLIAVNGRELTGADNIHEALQGTVGQQTTLLVNDRPVREGAREAVVEPIDNENALRLWDWVETNRRTVEAQSGGRVGYVYLPNTAEAGFSFFNRMYFAQSDRDGFIFDERANGGGQAADYIVDVLSAGDLGGWRYPEGLPFSTPTAYNPGPKVMLIDQDAGSGGDFLPYAFKRRGIGPLIGKRTWGGLIGISTNPGLVDGGSLTVPYFRFFTPEGEWRIENEGTAPDIDVDLDPIAANQGRDTQLERAIGEVMRSLAGKGPQTRALPPPPTQVGR